MEERLFPHIRALDDLDGMEEERRLCYVGMTRARERLYLLNSRRRYLFGQEQSNLPSRFLKEIPAELLDDGGGSPSPSPYPSPRGRGDSFHPRPAGEGGQRPGEAKHILAAVTAAYDDIEIVPEPPEEHDGVFMGMKVRHAKFGAGTIRKIEGTGEGQKVIVWFSSVGPKKLLLRFAGLERA
jgi:DNA helicase-2/ATP-dependent DNA helicase PcrA